MEKKYTDYMDGLSADELYEGLLAYGFFAEKLMKAYVTRFITQFASILHLMLLKATMSKNRIT